jgi:hypothetical protein
MEDFVDGLSRGNVAQVKTVLASVVLVLALYQVGLMAIGYGKVRVPFLKPKAASFTHRALGDTIVAITLLVAFMCITYFEVEDGIEHAADDEHVRAAVHVVAGALLLAVIALKVGCDPLVASFGTLPASTRPHGVRIVRDHVGDLGR